MAVWIVRAEDQPRGRQLLREAGLLESSRSSENSYLALPELDGGGARSADAAKRGRMRMRLVLLGLIGVWVRQRRARKAGDDAQRLSYLAEIVLDKPADLPAGLPVRVEFAGATGGE